MSEANKADPVGEVPPSTSPVSEVTDLSVSEAAKTLLATSARLTKNSQNKGGDGENEDKSYRERQKRLTDLALSPTQFFPPFF